MQQNEKDLFVMDIMVWEECKDHNSTECNLIYAFKNLCLYECQCRIEWLTIFLLPKILQHVFIVDLLKF